jgi:glyoxylase-like metal-dependent hydrolase (beta-lactamase superfamily II)
VWHWEAPHPEWQPSEPWHQVVSSYAIDDGARLLLFDPIAPPSEIDELAASRETVIALTAPWHERDTQSFVGRLGTPVFVPPSDSQEDLMQKYGVSAEQAAGGSPDVAWLLVRETREARLYAAGDRLPVGIEAFHGREPNDRVLWIESRRAVVAGDTLVDFGQGGARDPLRMASRGRDARADRRGLEAAARAAGSRGPYARALLSVGPARTWAKVGACPTPTASPSTTSIRSRRSSSSSTWSSSSR